MMKKINELKVKLEQKKTDYLLEKSLLDGEKRILLLYQKRGLPAPEDTISRYAELGITCLNMEEEIKDLENELLKHSILDV